MGHTGTGPVGSSNSSDYHNDLGAPRLPKVSYDKQEILGYSSEMWSVPKDAIYAAIDALQLSLWYMPQIKTDVPRWQKTLEQDIVRMQCALAELRGLRGGYTVGIDELVAGKNPGVSGSHKTAKEANGDAEPEHRVTVVCGEDRQTAIYLNGELMGRSDTNDAYEIARATKSQPCRVETRNPEGWQCGRNWPKLLKDVPL